VPGSTTARCAPPGVSFWSLAAPEQATSSQDQATPSGGSSHRRQALRAGIMRANMVPEDPCCDLDGCAQNVSYDKAIVVGNRHGGRSRRGSEDDPEGRR